MLYDGVLYRNTKDAVLCRNDGIWIGWDAGRRDLL